MTMTIDHKGTRHFGVSLLICTVLFVTCLITSNLLETKLFQIGKLTLTAGFIIFPVSYIVNDCMAEVWGFKITRLVIWLGFILNFLVVAAGELAVLLPPADCWLDNEPHFNYVFDLAPRITGASFVAFLIGSFLNAYVMSRMKVLSSGRHFSLRAIVSTIVGEGADSLVFFPLAFYGSVPHSILIQMMVIQVIAKTLYEIIALPLTIRIVKWIKKQEHIDVYDQGISYNILKVTDIR